MMDELPLPLHRVGGFEAEQLLAEIPDEVSIEEDVIWYDYVLKIAAQLAVIDARATHRASLLNVLLVQLLPHGSATIEERAAWIGVHSWDYKRAQRRLAQVVQTLQEQGF